MRPSRAASFVALLGMGLLACAGSGADTPDVRPEVAVEVSPDGGPDAAPDVATDATGATPYAVPLDPASPWPKFRRDAAQAGASPLDLTDDGCAPRAFQTGKGIFSSPVIDGEGNVYQETPIPKQ